MRETIHKLAVLGERGELPPSAEEALALTFADRYAARLRYVAKWGRWLGFDDTRWRFDDTLMTFDRARRICREVAQTCDKPTRNAIASAKTVAAVERLVRADRRLAATVAQWDAKPWLLTAGDATVSLLSGDSRPCNSLDYITKQAGCALAPRGTQHPLWAKFLHDITNSDDALQGFLQRYVGYCLSGTVSEHKFVFAYGTGANGKTTFVKTIAGVFGEHATAADMSTFVASRGERHPTDLAKLAGARLVVAQETQKGRRWDESKIKAITGGDTITARFMRQDFFDFEPTFKLLIAGNHKPRLSTVDEAMRRRLLLVPFTVQIAPAERDLALSDKLRAEWPAILRWCVNGCLQWQQEGLVPPRCVLDATDDYFAGQDTLQQWLDECTERKASGFTSLKELFASWKIWCEDRNHRPGSATTLSEMLVDKGFARSRHGHKSERGFDGVAIKSRS